MLQSLFAVHGRSRANRWKFPIYLSQDMNPANLNASGVQDVAAQHLDRVSYMQHLEVEPPALEDKKEKPVYYRIANHYKFILRTFFDCFGYERLIILEDDMQLSPDFFSYFEAAAPILDADDSLMCVSSWNDHGQDRFVRNATQLYRSDFFPGLGWMLNTRVWHSVRENWPKGYWDDYMRLSATRRGRQCIRPEVCRTYNFGDIGSSSGQYFRLFLKPIKLNDEDVRWNKVDMSYLQRDNYARMFAAELAAATQLEGVGEYACMSVAACRWQVFKELAERLRTAVAEHVCV
jgi:alpha-1,3-mannosyl-glycoprotein beta-1,2-N-acetylglucosaminyltransferase